MSWIILSLLAAVFESVRDVFGKFALKNVNEYIVSWSLWFFGLLLLLPFLFFSPIPDIGQKFWPALLIGAPLEILASLLYFRAIKKSDLSLVSPIVSFTPLFLLITSLFFLNEWPNYFGLIGVMLIVIGSYFLNFKNKKYGYLVPLQSLWREPGSRLMLAVAFIWSTTSAIGKIGVQNSSPLFWAVSMFALTTIIYFPIVVYYSKSSLPQIKKFLPAGIIIGGLFGLTVICQLTAYNLTLANYVISIKIFSMILSITFGYFIFKEKDIKSRLLAGLIMIIGVILISLFN